MTDLMRGYLTIYNRKDRENESKIFTRCVNR